MVPKTTCDASLSIELQPLYVHTPQPISLLSPFCTASQVWEAVSRAIHSFTELAPVQQQEFDLHTENNSEDIQQSWRKACLAQTVLGTK